MPEGMDGYFWQASPFYKFSEPLGDAVRKHRSPFIIGEDPIVFILPGIPQGPPPGILPALILQQEKNSGAGDPQRPLAGRALWLIDIAAFRRDIVPCLANIEHSLIQIDVAPSQAQKFCAPESGEQIKSNDRPPLDRLILQQLQQPPGIRLIQISCLPVGDAG